MTPTQSDEDDFSEENVLSPEESKLELVTDFTLLKTTSSDSEQLKEDEG